MKGFPSDLIPIGFTLTITEYKAAQCYVWWETELIKQTQSLPSGHHSAVQEASSYTLCQLASALD